MNCPVCSGKESEIYDRDKFRSYLRCLDCDLVYVPRDELLTFSAEKNRYEAHENDENQNYADYLNRIVGAIKPFLKKQAIGLDFGCGKSNLLEKLFRSEQVEMNSYDLFFHPDESVLKMNFDFIVLSEVIEHLRYPGSELLKLKSLLKAEGQIFIKTKFRPLEVFEFSRWFYKRDSTHIQFFNDRSFQKVAAILELEKVQMIGPDIFLFSR